MKKVIALATVGAMVLSLAACGGSKPAETTAAANTVEVKDFEAVYLAPGPATAEPANNNFATLYGVVDGKVYSAVIDMNAYKDFLNRYGTSLFIA